MKLRVRDVFANAYYKGTPTQEQIDDIQNGYGCKTEYELGTCRCDGRTCEECFDTLMVDLESEDERAERIHDEYDD